MISSAEYKYKCWCVANRMIPESDLAKHIYNRVRAFFYPPEDKEIPQRFDKEFNEGFKVPPICKIVLPLKHAKMPVTKEK